jgi:hypothetical protein
MSPSTILLSTNTSRSSKKSEAIPVSIGSAGRPSFGYGSKSSSDSESFQSTPCLRPASTSCAVVAARGSSTTCAEADGDFALGASSSIDGFGGQCFLEAGACCQGPSMLSSPCGVSIFAGSLRSLRSSASRGESVLSSTTVDDVSMAALPAGPGQSMSELIFIGNLLIPGGIGATVEACVRRRCGLGCGRLCSREQQTLSSPAKSWHTSPIFTLTTPGTKSSRFFHGTKGLRS